MFGFMCKGTHVKKVQLHQQKAGGKAMIFLDILLEECFVTSVVMSDSTGGDQPQVQYSLNFTKNTFKYTPQKNDGSPDATVTQTWNSKENKE
jgi:type VI protein secretion system component Hcp